MAVNRATRSDLLRTPPGAAVAIQNRVWHIDQKPLHRAFLATARSRPRGDTLGSRPRCVKLAVHHVQQLGAADDSADHGFRFAEGERINRFRKPLDRAHANLAERMVFHMQNRETYMKGPVARDARGRPGLTGTDIRADFNLSHHAGWVALAWTAEGKVGVDLARAGEASERAGRYVCSPQEWEYCVRLSGVRRQRFLSLVWAVKEAYAKAVGTGVHRGLKDLGFVPAHLERGEAVAESPGLVNWQFNLGEVQPGLFIAVASDSPYRLQPVNLL